VVSSHFGLDQPPNFENRHWHLHVVRPVEPGKEGVLEKAKQKLFAVREKRVRPGRDEKVLVSWNALAIRGMAHAGRVFGRAAWIASARRALDFIRNRMWRDGRLLATYKDGRAHLAAYLDDYAYLMAALIELLQSEFSLQDLEFAEQLAEVLLAHFEDADEVTGRFADELVRGVQSERGQIDAIIQQSSTHWKLERMARVDRNILRLAVYEILRRADIPVRVTLNEAVELGKKFGSEESSAFVNGVLDRIAHLELPNATPKLEKKA